MLIAKQGIRFRGHTIPELQQKLPKAKGGAEPIPEGLIWLLLTGELPTTAQAQEVSADLAARSDIPSSVSNLLLSLPKDMHPMTQFIIGITALQKGSKFFEAYQNGVHKSKYWDTAYEDSMDLIAKLPGIASIIYRHTYKVRQVSRDVPLTIAHVALCLRAAS